MTATAAVAGASPALPQHSGYFAEDIGHGDAGVEPRGDHAPQQGHVRGCGNAVARDIADDECDPPGVEEKAFVPIASNRVRLARWEIASRSSIPAMVGRAPSSSDAARR